MSGKHRWADIKRLRTCPHCRHKMSFHRKLNDAIGKLLEVDLWACSACENRTPPHICTVRGPMEIPSQARKKRSLEPFQGGKL